MKYIVDGLELNHCGHTPDSLLFTEQKDGRNILTEIPFTFDGIIYPKEE